MCTFGTLFHNLLNNLRIFLRSTILNRSYVILSVSRGKSPQSPQSLITCECLGLLFQMISFWIYLRVANNGRRRIDIFTEEFGGFLSLQTASKVLFKTTAILRSRFDFFRHQKAAVFCRIRSNPNSDGVLDNDVVQPRCPKRLTVFDFKNVLEKVWHVHTSRVQSKMTYDAKKGRQNRAIAYAPSPPRSVCLRLIVTPRTNKKIREFQTKLMFDSKHTLLILRDL